MNWQGPSSMTVQHTERLWRLSQAFLETGVASTASLQGLLGRVYAHDADGLAHVHRVAELAGRISEEMDLPAEVRDDLERAALLHDIGHLVVPEPQAGLASLPRPEARARRTEHLGILEEVTASLPFLQPAAAIVAAAVDSANGVDDESEADTDLVRMAGRVLHLADTLDTLSGICVRLSEVDRRAGAFSPAAAARPEGLRTGNDGEPWLSASLRMN